VICFDKLCLLSGLVWNRLADASEVSWRVPYVAAPGIHGHGAMLQLDAEDRDPPFVVEFLKKEFLRLPMLARNVFILTPEPEHDDSPIRDIRSAMDDNSIERFVGDEATLTADEKDMIDRLGKVVAGIKAEEIRALGVHSGVDRTIEALEYNVSFFCQLLLNPAWITDVHHPSRSKLLNKVWQLARETQRKAASTDNDRENHRLLYEKARSKAIRLADEHIRPAIEQVCPPPEEIWDNPIVVKWRRKIEEMSWLVHYVHGLAAYASALQRHSCRATNKEQQRINEGTAARDHLTHKGYQLPSYEDGCAGEQRVLASVKEAVLRFSAGLPEPRFPEHWEWRQEWVRR